MSEETIYHRIYYDDGFVVFDGLRLKGDTDTWLNLFQQKVDKIAKYDCLKFTEELWVIKDDEKVINENIIIINDNVFPYLDMEKVWNDRGILVFPIHLKPNQKLKYLSKDRTHLPSTF